MRIAAGKIMHMLELTHILLYLEPIQWFVPIAFVPLVCWQFCSEQSRLCRWTALISGYAVQIGFFLLLDDVGFQTSLLILIASIAAYFWISTTVGLWPAKKSVAAATSHPAEQESEVTA